MGAALFLCPREFRRPRPGFLPTLRVQAPLLRPGVRQRTQVFMHTGFSRCQGERVKILLFEGKNTMLAPCAFGDRPPQDRGGDWNNVRALEPVAVAPDARPRCDIPSAQRDLKVPLCCLNVLATILVSQASRCDDNSLLRGQTGQVLDSLTHARVLSTRVSVD
jgi:hypothetical protein